MVISCQLPRTGGREMEDSRPWSTLWSASVRTLGVALNFGGSTWKSIFYSVALSSSERMAGEKERKDRSLYLPLFNLYFVVVIASGCQSPCTPTPISRMTGK